MLEKSFVFLDGICSTTEKKLWENGIDSWQKFLDTESLEFLPEITKVDCDQQILQAISELDQKNSMHFKCSLPQNQLWRLYPNFKKDALFLDIETTGLGYENDVTVVGTYQDSKYEDFVLGKNLSKESLQEKLDSCSILVTFNGSQFDMPFLQKKFGVSSFKPHLDLRYVGYQLDLKGGLKKVEKILDITRSDETDGMFGREAIYLWRAYKEDNDLAALSKLRLYCKDDVINLEKLADIMYTKLTERYFVF